RRWQKKMHFLLSSMSVVYVLTTLIPDDGEDSTVDQLRKRAKWDNDDYVCRCLILNGMSDSLFDVYQNVESSKELCNSLEAKYMAKDASSKKFIVSNFTNYKMTDSRPVIEQYNELLVIFEKFLRMQDSDKPKGNNVVGPSVVNMVEHNNSSKYNDNKGKRKHHDNIKSDPNKKSKVTCWKCEKPGHLKKDCKGEKVDNKFNGSGINGLVDGSANSLKGQNMFNKSFQVYYVTYVSEAYFVQDVDVAWMQDSDKPKGNNVVGPSVVNMVEHNNSSKYNDNKGKRKHHDNIKSDPNKKSKVTCWKCEKPGHLKKDCKGEKVDNKFNGSGINGLVDGSANSLKGQNMFNKSFQVYYVTYVSEAYFVQDVDVAWWVDSGSTIH
nr:zinc finger, CCHC-type [Tanacetum cinerariifolium]